MRTHPAIAAAVVICFALFVLWRVRSDYTRRGALTVRSALLQFAMFFLHGLSSYSFLDSRTSRISTAGLHFPFALGLMAAGAVTALVGMDRLQWGDTVGTSVSALQHSGIYSFTRNPQLLAYLVFLAGYALLWPSWLGLAWLALYGVIAHVMVLTEEDHLRQAFGSDYEAYCLRTPRYIALSKGSWRR
jgi:protein-S-isoprenylcysteine O-methyltransferase Ste14